VPSPLVSGDLYCLRSPRAKRAGRVDQIRLSAEPRSTCARYLQTTADREELMIAPAPVERSAA
jgi:hypothetical protein